MHATQGNQGDTSRRHGEDRRPSDEVNVREPSIARVYDYLLGGKDHYAADREFGDDLRKRFPTVDQLARQNRTFLSRAVRYLVGEAGIDQLIDIGAGLPTADNTHQVARRANPDARVVYVDNDPLVLTHARALLRDDERTAVVEGDLRDPELILTDPATRHLIDFRRPVGLLFLSVLHFLPGEEPAQVLGYWWQAAAPGSFLVISHGEARPETERAAELYQARIGAGTPRTSSQIEALFHGWELARPGLVPVPLWRPETSLLAEGAESVPLLGGVARRTAQRAAAVRTR